MSSQKTSIFLNPMSIAFHYKKNYITICLFKTQFQMNSMHEMRWVCFIIISDMFRGIMWITSPLGWRHNERDSVSNHHPHDSLLNRLFRHISKKTSKLRVSYLCEGNSPVTSEISAQMTSNAENVSIWWRHHTMAPSNDCWLQTVSRINDSQHVWRHKEILERRAIAEWTITWKIVATNDKILVSFMPYLIG